MAKITLTQRVDSLEGCYASLTDDMEGVKEEVMKMTKWLQNGLGEKIASSVTTAVKEYQQEQWEREREERKLQLEEQRIKNAEIGQEKDAKLKMWGIIISVLNGGFIITLLSYMLTRG